MYVLPQARLTQGVKLWLAGVPRQGLTLTNFPATGDDGRHLASGLFQLRHCGHCDSHAGLNVADCDDQEAFQVK